MSDQTLDPRGVDDPHRRPAADPAIAAVYAAYPHIGPVLPAVGYDPRQLQALAATINRAAAEVVVSATPVDLARLLHSDKPIVRARYDFAEAGEPGLGQVIDDFLDRLGAPGGGR